MSTQYRVDVIEPQMRAHIEDLRARIEQHVPDAEFVVYRGDDPPGVYLAVISDLEDGFEVLDLVSDRLVDLQLEEDLALHVIPVHRTPPQAAHPVEPVG